MKTTLDTVLSILICLLLALNIYFTHFTEKHVVNTHTINERRGSVRVAVVASNAKWDSLRAKVDKINHSGSPSDTASVDSLILILSNPELYATK